MATRVKFPTGSPMAAARAVRYVRSLRSRKMGGFPALHIVQNKAMDRYAHQRAVEHNTDLAKRYKRGG